MLRQDSIAIDFGRRRLRALHAQRDGGILRVRNVILKDVPDELNIDDAEDYGKWVGQTLREAGFPRGRATIALAREHVGLKRIHLPTADELELPEMTRLAMQRELPFDAETAVIDFVPLATEENRTTVLAVAAPQQILDHAVRIAKSARLRVDRISLRSMGAALILKHLGDEPRDAVLSVDVTTDSIEFCVVEDGTVRFSRAAELGEDVLLEDLADSVVTETRRTWMSYRIAEGSAEIRHVLVMGDPRVCKDVAVPLGQMLHVEAEVLSSHPLVDANDHDMTRVWPLVGLMLEPAHGGQAIDFAHPRQAPNLTGERRKRMIYAAGAVLVLLLALWTFATRDLEQLEHRLAKAQSQQRELYPDYARFNRNGYKLRHLKHWEQVQVEWLDHLEHLTSLVPSDDSYPPPLVLDSWRGQQRFNGVEFERRSGEWAAPMQVTITVEGEARDRPTADAFREALVRADIYAASSTGPDSAGGRRLPYGFIYRLRTNAATVSETDEPSTDDQTDQDAEGGRE